MARIAFFGTPDFAVPALIALAQYCDDKHHELALVVTQIDQAQGRGQAIKPPPIKDLAQKLDLPLAQPLSLKKNSPHGEEFFTIVKNLDLDLAIVVAYGKIIPERFLKLARHGFVNVHASLLPRYRGAAPIQRAIEANDKETGVCLMDVVKGLDEGDVYACKKTPILASDTAKTLFLRLSNMGAGLLRENLDELLLASLKKQAQTGTVVYAHMLTKSEGLLDFNKPGALLAAQIRAFDPWPGSYAFIKQKRIKFFDSFFISTKAHCDLRPGTIVVAKKFLGIRTIDGILYVQHIQLEGKKIQSIEQALGFSLAIGIVVGSQ